MRSFFEYRRDRIKSISQDRRKIEWERDERNGISLPEPTYDSWNRILTSAWNRSSYYKRMRRLLDKVTIHDISDRFEMDIYINNLFAEISSRNPLVSYSIYRVD